VPSRYLEGKSVVITGSGRGIGAACARHAAEHGANVVVNDVDKDEAEAVATGIRDAGGAAIAVPADIASWDEAEGLIDACVSEFGRIDGLVNNAALYRLHTFDQQSEAELRAVINVNVLGTAFCGTLAARRMVTQDAGSIVNVTSGAMCGIPLQAAYSASKGAVASLVYTWALDLAGTNVRVNGMTPRAYTRMADYGKEYRSGGGGPAIDHSFLPSADSNAPLVTYLLSDRSAGLHGQIVRNDGYQIGLYSHPAVMLPVHRPEQWDVEHVERAFTEDLLGRQVPLGVVGVQIDSYAAREADWPSAG
jgi:NAD(P)-dependent dehydrogenase (short-subunit alcohol dehydrogenase family)